MREATSSSTSSSWVTSSSVPSYFCNAIFRALIASRSRLFVGSSRTRKLGFWIIRRQKISRAHSPPDSAEGLQGILSAEEHLSQRRPNFFLRRLWIELPEPLHRRHALAFIDGVAEILREIADCHLMAPGDIPGINRKLALRCTNKLARIADQRLKHGGFAGAVAARQRDFFTTRYARRELLDDFQPI